MLKFIENQKRNILLYWVSVLSSGGTGRMPGTPVSAFRTDTGQRTSGCRTSRFNAVLDHGPCPSVCNLSAFDMVDVRLVLRHSRFAIRE